MTIRRTQEKDISKLAEIFRIEKAKKPYSQYLTQKEAIDKIKSSLEGKEVYTLLLARNPEGFFICELREKKRQVYLDELWISDSEQGKGHGKEIMKFIEQEYKKRGFTEITLVADKNAKAAKFYENNGYAVKNEWWYMSKKI